MTILSNAVAIADKVTLALGMQTKVTLKTRGSDGGIGDPVETSKTHNAVVEARLRQVRSFSGELATSSTTVTFVRPTVVGAGDRIILKDGTGGEVIGTGGPVDASGQLITEAYIG